MTREEIINGLKGYKGIIMYPTEEAEALKDAAISALENIGHLKDRPCSVCEFHKENGCCKWICVFTDRLFGDMR